jgi:Uma2 family endonuclease
VSITQTQEIIPHRFTRREYYALAGSLDPDLRYELIDGVIYDVSPAKPPISGIITYLNDKFSRDLVSGYLVSVQNPLEIEPDGAPEPDIAIVHARPDFYTSSHPNGADTFLVIEVSDTERKPHVKMSAYMLDGRIPAAWRIDIPSRTVEVWDRSNPYESLILGSDDFLQFGNITFSVADIFAIIPTEDDDD